MSAVFGDGVWGDFLWAEAGEQDTFDVDASNALALDHTAARLVVLTKTATNALTLDHSVVSLVPIDVEATNALTLDQIIVVAAPRNVSATNALTLGQQVIKAGTIHAAAEQPLTLNSEAHVQEVFEPEATNALTLNNFASQPEITAPIIKSGDSTLNIQNFARSNAVMVNAVNELTGFVIDTSDPYNPVITSFALDNTASAELVDSVQQLVDGTNELTLDSAASAVRVLARAAANALILDNFISAFVPGGRCSLHEFIGDNAPVLVPRSTVVFSFPFMSPTLTLEIRAPELDNIDRLAFQRVSRETRGGTLIVFADDIWPKHKRLVVEFTALCEDEGQELQAFILQTVGKEFRYMDHESREWKALIVNPAEPVVRNRPDVLTAQLELEVTPA